MAIIDSKKSASYLDIESDTTKQFVNLIAKNVSKSIETYCNRAFEAARITEFHSGTGDSGVVFLNNRIVAVSAMWDDPDRVFGDDTLFATSDFAIFPTAGYIELITTSRSTSIPTNKTRFSKGVRNIRITYTGGYLTVPADVEMAALLWAGPQYKLVDQKLHGVSSIERGNILQTVSTSIAKMPDAVKELLNPYRVRQI